MAARIADLLGQKARTEIKFKNKKKQAAPVEKSVEKPAPKKVAKPVPAPKKVKEVQEKTSPRKGRGYTEENIRVYSDMAAVRKRPAMYIGSVKDATPLVNEVLDNANDEAMGGHASQVVVQKMGDEIIVTDTGRGMPLGAKKEKSGMVPVPVLLCTKLHSGGKFDSRAYEYSSGLHGVGLVAVNALSSFFEIEVYKSERNKKKAPKGSYFYFKGTFRNQKLESKEESTVSGKRPFSTRVTFTPDKNVFSSIGFDIDHIRQRMEFMAAWNKKNTTYFLINGEVQEEISATPDSFFQKYVTKGRETMMDPICISIEDKKNHRKLVVTLAICDDARRDTYGLVNFLLTPQGTHITGVTNSFSNVMLGLISSGKKAKETEMLEKGDTTIGLRMMVSIFLPENILSLDGQTKEKLETERKHFQGLLDQFEIQLASELKSHPMIGEIIARIRAYRAKLEHSTVFKNRSVRGITSEEDILIDCTSNNGELYLVEGESALGGFKMARNPDCHALIPMGGKVTNPIAASMTKLLRSKEFSSLVQALGIGARLSMDTVIDVSKLRYRRIIVSCDADDDGKHITVLVLAFFMRWYPELVKSGFIFVVEAPLFKVTSKRKRMPAWSFKEAQALMDKFPGSTLTRFKGLGEMNPDEVKEYLLTPGSRRLLQIKWADESSIEYVTALLNSSELRQKLVDEKE